LVHLNQYDGLDGLIQTAISTSRATTDFKTDVEAFLTGSVSHRVKVESRVPRVKVRRLLTQLLASEPALEIDRVVIRGASGCSDFVGSVEVETKSGAHVFDFVWCCRWKAESEGLVDYFGFPDQMRAAIEFDWLCFQRWERRS
jgi:hypothetical protein